MATETLQAGALPPRSPRESEVLLAQMMLPTDANPHGNVHGGVIMMLADTAGGLAATRHCRRRVVTVTVDSMTFLHPVFVGDLLRLRACLTWTGRTSMEAEVTVEAEDVISGRVTTTSTAYLVYVALDGEGKPVPIPPLTLETADDRRRWREAEGRQAHRLALRGGES
ncbi:MAG TPA: acyl-CoA thioesterase [Thermomicrobiaceae bacterium]|nr:acyl-CoA thioesterase [Thermomicrobiaceae bacterium]